MTSKECEEQLQRLIYDWETELLLTKINATDIKAIKHLMLENQTQQDFINTQNKLIHDLEMNISKAIKFIEEYQYLIVDSDSKEELLEILRGTKDEENI